MRKLFPILLALVLFGGSQIPKIILPKTATKATAFLTKMGVDVTVKPHVNEFIGLPTLYSGRIKPLDTIARNHLRLLADTEKVKLKIAEKEEVIPPAIWLLDTVSGNSRADLYPVFRIQNLELLEKLQIKFSVKDHYRFSKKILSQQIKSFDYTNGEQTVSRWDFIQSEADTAQRTYPQNQTVYEKAVIVLAYRLKVYEALQMSFNGGIFTQASPLMSYNLVSPFIGYNLPRVMPNVHGEWESFLVSGLSKETSDLSKKSWHSFYDLLLDWKRDDFSSFNQNLTDFKIHSAEVIAINQQDLVKKRAALVVDKKQKLEVAKSAEARENVFTWVKHTETYLDRQDILWKTALTKTEVERFYNHWDPFYSSLVLYILTAIFSMVGLLVWHKFMWRFAMTAFTVAFLVHTTAILLRWYISSYPPVTDLYSSAVFIGWGVAFAALGLELVFKRYFALISGALVTIGSLIVAQNLLGGEDSMGMMRAVLDTKFWLTTHVITITLGYTATFLAGGIAFVWIVGRLFKFIKQSADAEFARALYGLVCYALLLSFIGTVLGGLWADDSWGRFWGWDPKENGALMIVIWNAIILHARLSRLINLRGFAAMALVGNIITCFSWFGVNLLGVGLHSYGFTNNGLVGVLGFSAINLIFIIICLLPLKVWRQTKNSEANHG